MTPAFRISQPQPESLPLSLFGPTAPEVWAPRGDNVTVLRHDPIAELPVQRVLAAANRLLGSS